jgi:hypothetical protein
MSENNSLKDGSIADNTNRSHVDAKDPAKSSFKDWLAYIAAILGFLLTFSAFISTLLDWTKDPQKIRVFSIASFTLYVLGSLWVAQRILPKRENSKRIIIALLFVVTACYFTWIGTWIGARTILIDANAYPIEQGSVTASVWEGTHAAPPVGGTGKLSVTSDTSEGMYRTSYKFAYDIPSDGEAWAGATLAFPQPMNFADYNSLEFTIVFGCPDARLRLYVQDAYGKRNSVILGDGSIIKATTQPQTVTLPLKTLFPDVARSSIKLIDLDTNNSFTTGSHYLTISDIHFQKQQ